MAFFFFLLMGQLLCFPVSLPDQINVPLGGCNAFPRFLLKGVQNVNPRANLDRQHDPVGVRGVPQGNLKDATRPPLLVP